MEALRRGYRSTLPNPLQRQEILEIEDRYQLSRPQDPERQEETEVTLVSRRKLD